MARDHAGRVGWKAKQASSYLVTIGRGWRVGWRTGTHRGSWFGGREIILLRGQGAGVTASGDRQVPSEPFIGGASAVSPAARWARARRDASRLQAVSFG